MSMSRTVGFAALACLFILAGAVQYNDPDPFIWMLLYGGGAALALAAVALPVPRWLIALEALVALAIFGSMLFEGVPWALADNEEMREIGGLALVWVGCLVIARFSRSPHELWVDGRQLA